VAPSSDMWMMSEHPLLLCCYCSDTLVAMDQLPMITMTYGPLLQYLFIAVDFFLDNDSISVDQDVFCCGDPSGSSMIITIQ
jgi:hypothetical protein